VSEDADFHCSRCGEGSKWEQMNATAEGHLFCPDCWSRIDAKHEPKRRCPADGAEMKKQLIAGMVLLDKCPECGGTWFDQGELDVIKKMWQDESWNKGFFWGWLL
jgi:DNA-directed RNA polymerase subunit RPC12/RpoP